MIGIWLIVVSLGLASDVDRSIAPDFPARDTFVDPPYAREPGAPVAFRTPEECRAHRRSVTTPMGRFAIRRLDAVFRRCEREDGYYVYRESHAYATLDPVLDPILFAQAGGLLLGVELAHRDLVARGSEKWAVGCTELDCQSRPHPLTNYAAPKPGWETFSDVLLFTSMGISPAPLLFSKGNARYTDTLIMSQVMLTNAAITQAAKRLTAEPRPFAFSDLRDWDPNDVAGVASDLRGNDAWTSYFSGHTSWVAASTFGLATVYAIRGRRPVALIAPYSAALAATVLVGTARVLALRHDPVDVLVGGVTGAIVGIWIPFAHAGIARVIDPELRARRDERRAARRVHVIPTAGPTSVGLQGVF